MRVLCVNNIIRGFPDVHPCSQTVNLSRYPAIINNPRGPEKHTQVRCYSKSPHVLQLTVNALSYPATMKTHRPKVLFKVTGHVFSQHQLHWGDWEMGTAAKKGSLAAGPYPLVTYLKGNIGQFKTRCHE